MMAWHRRAAQARQDRRQGSLQRRAVYRQGRLAAPAERHSNERHTFSRVNRSSKTRSPSQRPRRCHLVRKQSRPRHTVKGHQATRSSKQSRQHKHRVQVRKHKLRGQRNGRQRIRHQRSVRICNHTHRKKSLAARGVAASRRVTQQRAVRPWSPRRK